MEENANLIEPGFSMMTDGQKQDVLDEVKSCLDSIYETHGNGQWKEKLIIRDVIADICLQQVLTITPYSYQYVS